MADRVAVLGLLNKRNGIVRDLTLKPGQSVRVRDVVVRLRACETTAPWESEVLTGAFVQLDVERPDKLWQRVFSGWLYKESPSLNVVEHPVYDVWPKSCAMTYPAGPSAPAAPVEFEQSVEREEIGRHVEGSRCIQSVRASGQGEPGATAGRSAAAKRRRQQRDIARPRHVHCSKRGEVIGHELAVEQGEAADLEPRHEPGERDL